MTGFIIALAAVVVWMLLCNRMETRHGRREVAPGDLTGLVDALGRGCASWLIMAISGLLLLAGLLALGLI